MKLGQYFGILTLLLITRVGGDGRVTIRLLRYTNTYGLGDNGHCCDGRWAFCPSACDHYFVLCLHTQRSSQSSQSCAYGTRTTPDVANMDTIDFEQDAPEFPNVVEFAFTGRLPTPVTLRVHVYDRDSSGADEFVDYLQAVMYFSRTSSSGTARTYTLTARTSLELQARLICAPRYYGDGCGVRCDPPGPTNHYTCDHVTGEAVCNAGYTGVDCSTPLSTTTPSTTTQPTAGDCDELAKLGYEGQSGIYTLYVGPSTEDPFPVYCHMDGRSGWTVIQRRVDGRVNFVRGWQDYKEGFGVLGTNTSLWMGLEKMHWMTNSKRYKLRISLHMSSDEVWHANYDNFRLGSEQQNYTLYVTDYSGTAGDALQYHGFSGARLHNGKPFTTKDRDHDSWANGNCAQKFRGGWWHNDCFWCNLNGPYVTATHGSAPCTNGQCIAWGSLGGAFHDESLQWVEMRIIPFDSQSHAEAS